MAYAHHSYCTSALVSRYPTVFLIPRFPDRLPVHADFTELRCFVNDDKTRTFIVICCSFSDSEFENLVCASDKAMTAFSQPEYYKVGVVEGGYHLCVPLYCSFLHLVSRYAVGSCLSNSFNIFCIRVVGIESSSGC